MSKIIINGGRRLFGEIYVSGSKNAALPILFATIVTRGISKIKNIPDIGDVRVAMKLLSDMGARICREGDAVYIDTTELKYRDPDNLSVSRIRASTYLIGSCLARFGISSLGNYGGCNFSARPIDMHIKACRALGAVAESGYVRAPRLVGGNIHFEKPSVGATINAVIMASSAHGETVITGHAREPHVNSLVDFLISAGADISITDSEIRISGRELRGGNITVIGDMIEAGTYLAAGLITDGAVKVSGVDAESLSAYLSILEDIGAQNIITTDSISSKMCREPREVSVKAMPYPGFPTDLQPIIAPVLSKMHGGVITDTVWESRFGYLEALSKFGIDYHITDGSAHVMPSHIHHADVHSPDLRGGAACILAALAAKGESTVHSSDTVLRGYEDLIGKMRHIGADIRIE